MLHKGDIFAYWPEGSPCWKSSLEAFRFHVGSALSLISLNPVLLPILATPDKEKEIEEFFVPWSHIDFCQQDKIYIAKLTSWPKTIEGHSCACVPRSRLHHWKIPGQRSFCSFLCDFFFREEVGLREKWRTNCQVPVGGKMTVIADWVSGSLGLPLSTGTFQISVVESQRNNIWCLWSDFLWVDDDFPWKRNEKDGALITYPHWHSCVTDEIIEPSVVFHVLQHLDIQLVCKSSMLTTTGTKDKNPNQNHVMVNPHQSWTRSCSFWVLHADHLLHKAVFLLRNCWQVFLLFQGWVKS